MFVVLYLCTVAGDFLSNTSLCNAAITSLGLMCIPAPLPITSEDSKTLTNKLLDMIFDTKLTSKVGFVHAVFQVFFPSSFFLLLRFSGNMSKLGFQAIET